MQEIGGIIGGCDFESTKGGAMGGMREFSVDEFLAYETRGRGTYLGAEWKKRGWLQFFLHRRRPFAAGWQHQIPRIDIRDDPQTGQPKRVIYGGSYRCIESDDVLENQFKRDRDTGVRTHPPAICPIDLMVDYIRELVDSGQLHWLEPVFDFDVGNAESRVVIRASGLWGYGKWSKFSDQQKAELADAGVYEQHAWKERFDAGVKYVVCIVDAENPAKGVQIWKENQAVGDAIKLAIAKEMKRNPRDKSLGDPVQHPYAMCMEYHKDESPQKKYQAYRVEVPLDQHILDLIDSPAPDISSQAGNYMPETLQSQLEKAALFELPWDRFFTKEAIAALKVDDDEPAPTQAAPRTTVAVPPGAPTRPRPPTPQATHALPPGRPAATAPRAPGAHPPRVPGPPPPRPAPPPVQAAPAAEDMVACDGCGVAMPASAARCPSCGMQYEVDAPEPPPPQAMPPLRKRSEARRSAASPAPAQRPPPRPIGGPPQVAARPPRPQAAQPPAPPPPTDETAPPESGNEGPSWGEFGDDPLPF